MFVYLLGTDLKGEVCNTLLDVPTVIGASVERAKMQFEELRPSVQRDIQDFVNVLVKLVKSHPSTASVVRILSVPSLPTRFSLQDLPAIVEASDWKSRNRN